MEQDRTSPRHQNGGQSCRETGAVSDREQHAVAGLDAEPTQLCGKLIAGGGRSPLPSQANP